MTVQNLTFQLNDFDRVVFLPQTEDLEIAEDRLLGLSVTIDLDAQEVALVLPMKFALKRILVVRPELHAIDRYSYLADVEQVLLPQDGTAGERQESDASRLIGEFRCPVGKDVFTGLLRRLARLLLNSIIAILLSLRTPLEISNALDLQALLAIEHHAGRLVDADHLPMGQATDKLVVGAPLECGPGHLLLRDTRLVFGRGGEGSEEITGFDVPDSDVVALIVGREVLRSLDSTFGNNDRFVRPGHDVVFAGGKVDELDHGVRKALHGLPGRTTPQTNTLSVQSSDVCSEGGPSDIQEVLPILYDCKLN